MTAGLRSVWFETSRVIYNNGELSYDKLPAADEPYFVLIGAMVLVQCSIIDGSETWDQGSVELLKNKGKLKW